MLSAVVIVVVIATALQIKVLTDKNYKLNDGNCVEDIPQ